MFCFQNIAQGGTQMNKNNVKCGSVKSSDKMRVIAPKDNQLAYFTHSA